MVLQRVRGLLFIFHLWLASAIGSLLVLFPACVLVWPLSRTLYRRWASIWARAWFSLVVFHLEQINGVKLHITGEELPRGESCLVILNHPSEVDWFFSWSLAIRFGSLAAVKIMLKRTLVAVPGFGWGMLGFEYLFVERRWHGDKERIRSTLGTLCSPEPTPLFLVVFPEGTDWKEHKLAKCHEYAKTNPGLNLPLTRHVLLPRPRGFAETLAVLRRHAAVASVLDCTLAYGPRGALTPSPLQFAAGRFPAEVHVHVRRHPLAAVPEGEEAVAAWLADRFREKDALLASFHAAGAFPAPPCPAAAAPSRPLLAAVAAAWTAVLAAALRGLFGGGLFGAYCGLGGLYFTWLTCKTGWSAAGPVARRPPVEAEAAPSKHE